MSERQPSIRRRLLAYLGALFVAGIGLLFFAVRGYGRSAADRSYDQLLTASALSIAESVALVQNRWRVDLPYAALELLAMAPEDRVFYRIAAPDGRTLTGYHDLPRPTAAAVSERPVLFDAAYSGETVRFVVRGRFIADPSAEGWASVTVGQTRRARDALAREIAWGATLPIVVLMLLSLLLVWVGVRHALQPMARVEQDLATREPSELRPLTGPVPTELTQVIIALNHFMARLALNVELLRGFIGEAAHQMRTPLAALFAQAQEAIDDDEPAQQRRSLMAIERNARQLSRLFNQLLSDATVSHRADLQRFEEIDLAAIVNDALREVLPQAEPRPELIFACSGDTRMRGDALMLREAIKNLVDNALRYGVPERGALQLALRADAERCVVSVCDHGPGIVEDDLARVLERFERGKEAAADGSGLGLAIVKRVVESHGGSLSLNNREGGGLMVRVDLPRRAQ